MRDALLARSELLDNFKFTARGRRGPNPPRLESDDDWWALAQHQGLATPLLDWTSSPFVAAFFAYADVSSDQTPQRALFALHAPSIEGWSKIRAKEQELANNELAAKTTGIIARTLLEGPVQPELTLIKPLSDENDRLVSQGGQFTKLRSLAGNLEDWVTKNHPEDDGSMSLIKFLLPNSDREVALRALNRMNINFATLFPDLTGASRHCNMQYEIDDY